MSVRYLKFKQKLNLKFEKFDKRHLSLKALEHALSGYYRYVQIYREVKGGPLRHYRTVDTNSTTCSGCKCDIQTTSIGTTNWRSCNTCTQTFCKLCAEGKSHESWICQDCLDY